MSRKHADLEREFLADLEPRTGRSLDVWLAAIDAAGLPDRNAIIDWLRPQGLTFSHASWLERIHHNGGRPIYADVPERPFSQQIPVPAPAIPASPLPTPPPVAPPSPSAQPPIRPAPTSAPTPPPRPTAPKPAAATPPSTTGQSLDELLARGKGLRPLASMLLQEMTQALPGLVIEPSGDFISLRRPNELGVLLVGPRELRLGLDLANRSFNALLTRSRIPGTSNSITHMLVLSDARQINADLIEMISAADANANPRG